MLARRTPASAVAGHYSTATAQAYNSGESHSTIGTGVTLSNTLPASITAAPPDIPEEDRICLPGQTNPCSFSKTADGLSIPGLKDQCVVWDSSCSGNKTAAVSAFFEDTLWRLEEKPCWKQSTIAACTLYEPPETMSEMARIKDWMRTPQCFSIAKEYGEGGFEADSEPGDTCCGLGIITAENVDVYYWPDASADTSCLSIIGDHVNALEYGATTSAAVEMEAGTPMTGMTQVYWGCTAINNVSSIIKTAQITSIGSLTFKESLVNPWSPPACISDTSAPAGLGLSTINSQPHASLHARGHSLIIPSSITQDGGLPITTVVSDGFTFTSPSIYANFHGIRADDWCGLRGASGKIATTMLTFSPGELSTIAGRLDNPAGAGKQEFSTKRFDFADLPCPPQSVMEANWWKPEPGEPYRPLIAMPSKVKAIDPWYANCSDLFFTGFDPPRTLEIASVMVSDLTNTGIEPTAALALPGITQDVGRENTNDNQIAATTSTYRPFIQPYKTSDPEPAHKSHLAPQETQAIEPEQLDKDPISFGRISGSQNSVSGNLEKEPKSATADNTMSTDQLGPFFDPDHVLPNQMSQIESVLAPSPQNQPTAVYSQDAGPGQTGSYADGQWTPGGDLSMDGNLYEQISSADHNSQIISMPRPAPTPATTVAGDAIITMSDGVSIHSNIITTGAADAAVSSALVSVNQPDHIHLGVISYQLPVLSPGLTTLVDGKVMVSLPSVAPITTVLAELPLPAILGAPSTGADPDNVSSSDPPSTELSIPGTIPMVGDPTLVVPETSILSNSSTSVVIPASAELRSHASSLSTGTDATATTRTLGALIMGGLGTGAPLTRQGNLAASTAESTKTAEHATFGGTDKIKGQVSRKLGVLLILQLLTFLRT